MNRRTFITLIAVFVLTLFGVTPTLAQEEQEVFKLEYDQQAKASRDFDSGGIRFDGAMRYDFVVMQFENPDDAEEALMQLNESMIEDYFSFQNIVPNEVLEVSVPQTLGDNVYGWRVLITNEGTDITLNFIFVQEAEYTYMNMGIGLTDSTQEMADILTKQRERIAEATPEPDDLLDRLPTLADMPTGFALTEEKFEESTD